MNAEDLKQIEELIKKHKPSSPDNTFIYILLLMFLNGCFKGCGY